MANKKRIQILDCSEIAGNFEDIKDGEAFKSFAQQLGDGIRHSGFVYLINHPVPRETVAEIMSKTRDFFNLPPPTKNKYKKIDAPTWFHGFTGTGDENVASLVGIYTDESVTDRKETLDIWGLAAKDEANYPVEIPAFKESIDSFRSSLVELTHKLFYAFALYLDIPDKTFFWNCHKAVLENAEIPSHNFIRSNYYYAMPPKYELKEESKPLRLGEHADIDTFSFLIQDDVGGLEAKVPNGDWVPVPPIKDTIVFNLGFMMEVWAGGKLPATPHRVALKKDTILSVRQSLAMFVQPDGPTHCKPIIEKTPGWIPPFPIDVTQPHFEYFSGVLRQILTGYS